LGHERNVSEDGKERRLALNAEIVDAKSLNHRVVDYRQSCVAECVGGSKFELNDAVVVVAVVSVAAAVAVAAVVAVVREGKPEPPLSVSVVECRWIQLPLSDLRRKWMFSECRRYRGNEMRVGQGLLLKEELACFDGCGKRERDVGPEGRSK
jgi:hypothetical protein